MTRDRRGGSSRSRPGGGRPLAYLLTAVAILLGGFAWWLARNRGAPGPPGGIEPVSGGARTSVWRPAPDTVALMDPYAAHDRALDLAREDLPEQSLPYYRRAITGLPDVPWLFRHDYSSALLNATGQSQMRRGFAGPLSRGSDGRALLMRESLRQLDLAEGAARTPGDRAFVLAARGHRYQTWGLPWDALEEFRAATRLDPGWREPAAAASSYEARMRRPEVAGP